MPVVPLGLRVLTTSGAGSSAPLVPFPLACTRKYPPAGITPVSGATPVKFAAPVAERYCSEVPSSVTSAAVGL